MTTDIIKIPTIELHWTKWYGWNEFKISARSTGGILIPENTPGVYKIRYNGNSELLDIGKTIDLRRRIKKDLVRTNGTHSAGKRIRRNETVAELQIRWAVTDRPAAAKEHLLIKYKEEFGNYPKYVKNV